MDSGLIICNDLLKKIFIFCSVTGEELKTCLPHLQIQILGSEILWDPLFAHFIHFEMFC